MHREIRLDSILDVMECAEPPSSSHSSKARTAFTSNPLSPSIPNSPPGQGLDEFSGGEGESSSNCCFKIITPSRAYIVCAPSEEEEIKWLSAIRVLLDKNRAREHPPPA